MRLNQNDVVKHFSLRFFKDLPLGTRFKYYDVLDNGDYDLGSQIWVILERYGCGKVAAWDGIDIDLLDMQSAFSAAESQEDCENLMVIAEPGI